MYEEILEKRMILERQKPFDSQTRTAINKYNELDCIYGSLVLQGTKLYRNDVENMLAGKLVKAASLKECTFIENYYKTLAHSRSCLSLKSNLDSKMLLQIYGLLINRQPEFRKTILPSAEFSHVPAQPSDIEGKLNVLLRNVYREISNPIKAAAHLHCVILEIYPFEEYNEVVASMAMNYYLVEKGFYPVALGFSRGEYIATISKCLKDKDEGALMRGLERAVYNKLDVMCQIVAENEEK